MSHVVRLFERDPLDTRGTDRVALLAVAGASAVVAPALLFRFEPVTSSVGEELVARFAVVGSTMLLSALLCVIVLRAKAIDGARALTVSGAAGLGFFNGVASRALVALVRGQDVSAALVHDGLGAGVAGVMIGFLFGAAYAPLLRVALNARLRPSFDAADRVAFAAGATLLAAGASTVPWAEASADVGTWYAAPAMGIGAFAMVRACLRIHRTAKFVGRVRTGAEPGYRIVARTDRNVALSPLVRTAFEPTAILEREGVANPYRGERRVAQLALVPVAGVGVGLRSLAPPLVEELGLVCATVLLGAISLVMLLFPLLAFVGCISGWVGHV